ncbi:MAG: HD family phosphohydrolase [Planctomycetota bacterium]
MGFFGDHKAKSWQRLSFKNKLTKAGVLAQEQSRSRRLWRLTLTLLFATAVTLVLSTSAPSTLETYVRLGAAALLLHFVMYLLVRAFHPEVLTTFSRYLAFIGATLLLAKLMLLSPAISPYMVPLPLLAMILAVMYGGLVAVHSSLAVAALLGLLVHLQQVAAGGVTAPPTVLAPIAIALSQFTGCVIAVLGVRRIRTRTRLVTVGMTSGAAMAMAALVFHVWGMPQLSVVPKPTALLEPGWALLSGLCSGVLFTSLLPFMERIFDLTTEMRLLELADQNRPLLRELSLLAPGSFQHSLMVGQLAEEAAQSIGANDLLARVGALYHDVGKMLKPNYFIENMRGDENIHDKLSPEMSRLIIISHVKDGIRIAEEEGLPQPIIDMIPMHHGTSIVEYFYHKKRQLEDKDARLKLSDSGHEAFRYPGPRPTFPEAGILMIADSVEARSRVLQDPTPARLRTVVRELIEKKMSDGQLDECELTMNDFSRIEDAFVRVLTSIHHGRIKYPSQSGGANERKLEDLRLER